jgi:hypothetical protein
MPELLRVQGETILKADPTSVTQARELFGEAAAMIREQDVAMLGLRLAVSEARLDRQEGNGAQAVARLMHALDIIDAADDCLDVTEARDLLAATADPVSGRTGGEPRRAVGRSQGTALV